VTEQESQGWFTKNRRSSVLFVIGCITIIGEVLNAIIRNNDIHSAIIVLGTTLCGVGAIGRINNGR
jgi:hypothetical protein